MSFYDSLFEDFYPSLRVETGTVVAPHIITCCLGIGKAWGLRVHNERYTVNRFDKLARVISWRSSNDCAKSRGKVCECSITSNPTQALTLRSTTEPSTESVPCISYGICCDLHGRPKSVKPGSYALIPDTVLHTDDRQVSCTQNAWKNTLSLWSTSDTLG